MAKLVDLLDEDRPIAEQKFACLSFVSPEYIIKNKNLFLFESFLEEYNFNKSMEKFTKFINFVSYKYNIKSDDSKTTTRTLSTTMKSAWMMLIRKRMNFKHQSEVLKYAVSSPIKKRPSYDARCCDPLIQITMFMWAR